MSSPVTIAAVQATPIFLDREATVARVCELVGEAAEAGADLVVLPEAFVPGYPDWVWRTRPWSHEATVLFACLQAEAVVLGDAASQAMAAAARGAGVHLAVGVNERDRHGATVYNTLLVFGADGSLLHRHRKLMPTGGERLVWGSGDGSSLRVFDTPLGRIGGLLCWENYMPLARAALYAQGLDIWLAPTWDTSDVWVSTLRHIAKEGRVHVVGVAPLQRGSDLPEDVPHRDDLWGGADDWMSRGLSTIVAPDGEVLAGPLVEEEGLLLATVDPAAGRVARQQFDPSGHYARDDIFRLEVDRRRRQSVDVRADSVPDEQPDRVDDTAAGGIPPADLKGGHHGHP